MYFDCKVAHNPRIFRNPKCAKICLKRTFNNKKQYLCMQIQLQNHV